MNQTIGFTGETREEDGFTFKRIKAIQDIPSWNVKAGTTGGWVTEGSTIEKGSWVANNAVLQESHLKGAILLKRHAYVKNSIIEGAGTIGGDACIEESTVQFSEILLSGSSWIFQSLLKENEEQSSLCLNDDDCIIQGQSLHPRVIKEAIGEMIQEAMKSEPVILDELFGDEVSAQ